MSVAQLVRMVMDLSEGSLRRLAQRPRAELLRAEGIGCNNYFPPIHLQPYMIERFGFKRGDFPVCEHVAARTLALPLRWRPMPSQ